MDFFEHAVLGFCWWDIPGLIALIAITVAFFVEGHKLKEERKDLESRL